jgi:hypothetical protein
MPHASVNINRAAWMLPRRKAFSATCDIRVTVPERKRADTLGRLIEARRMRRVRAAIQ